VAILDKSVAGMEQAMDDLRASGGRCMAVACDVTDAAAIEEAIGRIEIDLGCIEGLVTSAGISLPQAAESMPLEKWNAVIGVNLTGTFLSCQAVGRRMVQRRKGAIVAISSIDGLGGHSQRANYAASKFGISGVIKSLAIDWGRYGIRVNAVAPGVVDTPLLRGNMSADYIDNVMSARTALGRLSLPVEQANACLFLLSKAAEYITGIVLSVDGGLSAGYFNEFVAAEPL
jgi:3-oxoacyl-[acyl-carrier protein] reductase